MSKREDNSGVGSFCGAGVPPAAVVVSSSVSSSSSDNFSDGQKTFEKAILKCEPKSNAGSCCLSQPVLAQIVQDAILFFEGKRYWLDAWCVMPNHVHVVLTPSGEEILWRVMHSWKSYTAKLINRHLGGRGLLWERESFDHAIRSVPDLERFVDYVHNNPVAAGLCARPTDWAFSSAGAGFVPAAMSLTNVRTQPFSPIRSRGELPHLEKSGATYFVTFCLADVVGL